MKNTMLDTVLSYAAKGYLVFPCKPRSKEPATKHGFKDATTDPQTIRGWWSDNPNYNVAIRTGEGSGLLVVDIDGEEGQCTLAMWREQGKQLPHSASVETSKGIHVYLGHPGQRVGNSVKSVPGIDVREEGGYVLAPPSIHPSGELYRWRYALEKAGVADSPTWLLRELTRPSERLSAPVEATIPEGQRNSTLFSLARSLFMKGLNETEAFAALSEVNRNRCQPPLDDTEALSIVESAATYERRTIRVANEGKRGFTANELMNMDIPPMRWAIPDLLPEGVTILGGKPKIGKSWLALGLCVATATGGVALGTKHVDQGDALYLALEDNKRRLQERLGKVLTSEAPHNFQIYLDWPRLNEGGDEQWSSPDVSVISSKTDYPSILP